MPYSYSEVARMRDNRILTTTAPNVFSGASFEVVYSENGFLVFHDLDLSYRASVTNDINHVLGKLSASGYDLPKLKIIYRDSRKIYDAVLVKADGSFNTFAPINSNNMASAFEIYDTRYTDQTFKNRSLTMQTQSGVRAMNEEAKDERKAQMMANLFAARAEADNFRIESRKAGVPALLRLVDIAKGDTGQCIIVRRLLLSCYNGQRFPFDLTNLRSLDLKIYQDCILVLNMDSRLEKEVHQYVERGGDLFESWADTVLSQTDIRDKAMTQGVIEVLEKLIFGHDLKSIMESYNNDYFKERLNVLVEEEYADAQMIERWMKKNLSNKGE